DITIKATDKTILEAFAIGGSYASGDETSVAVSGAASVNLADNTIGAYITGSSGARSIHAGGALSLLASDDAMGGFSEAGAVAIAWGSGQTNSGSRSLSIGASVALNRVGTLSGYSVKADIDDSTVTANEVDLTAESKVNMHALAVGGAFSNAPSSVSGS